MRIILHAIRLAAAAAMLALLTLPPALAKDPAPSVTEQKIESAKQILDIFCEARPALCAHRKRERGREAWTRCFVKNREQLMREMGGSGVLNKGSARLPRL